MKVKEGEVRLEEYNPHWRKMFAHELEELWEYFGDYAIRISHIGSTAIDNIEAKPIIDIVVAVGDLEDFSFVSHKFTSNPEYSIKNDFDNDEILIRKGDKLNRSFYIHVMDIDSKRYKDVIFFRDILLHDVEICNDYRNLKRVLARKYSTNRKKYTASKAEFIESTLEICWARKAFWPSLVASLASLVALALSIYLYVTQPADALFCGMPSVKLAQIGILFGGTIFLTTVLAVCILLKRYLVGRKKYNYIVSKINREISKE